MPHLRCLICFLLFLNSPSSLPALDCNGNGWNDEEEIASGQSEDCNRDRVPDECEASPPPLGPVGRLRVVGSAFSLAVADLDGDERVDLALGTSRSSNYGVSLFLRDEEGQFQQSEDWLPNTREVLSVVAADLDGNGDSDLIALDRGGIRAYLGHGPDGFGDRVTVSTRDDMTAIAATDLNGDGFEDVLATQLAGDLVAVFLSQGDGNFAPLEDRPLDAPRDLVLGDLDGDGNLEVVVTAADGIALLASTGNGTLVTTGRIGGLGDRPRSPALGDFDGDGRLDMTLATDSGIVVLAGQNGGTYEISATYASDPAEREVTALSKGDVDFDGDLDLIIGLGQSGAPGGLLFLINRGDGSFRFTTPLELEASPDLLAVHDLDDDGDGELLLVSRGRGEVHIFWHEAGSLPFLPPLRLSQVRVPLSERFEPHVSALRDVDGDEDLDIVTMDGEDKVMVLTNEGDGELLEGEQYSLNGADELIAIVSVDLDNDRSYDIAANDEQTNNLLVLINQGDGTFVQSEEIYSAGARPASLTAGDIDGDGFQDLVSVNVGNDTLGIFYNLGDATFTSEVALEVGDGPVAAVSGDFDGDGDSDLVAACAGSSTLSVLANNGDGTFGDPVDLDIQEPRYVTAVDLDGDADLDLVTAHEADESLGIFLNDGQGIFELEQVIDIGRHPRSVIAREINRDGLPDLVAANERDDAISIVLSLQPNTYAPALTYRVGEDPRYALAGDLDGDGDAEVLSANHSSFDFSVFFNQTSESNPPSYLETVCTEMDFYEISVSSGRQFGVDRVTRFLLPLEENQIPTLFENAGRHPSQREFLTAVFPEVFPDLTPAEYDLLVGRRATRQYYSGQLFRLRSRYGIAYGFEVLTSDVSGAEELLTAEETLVVYDMLTSALALGPLVYHPTSLAARENAASWTDPGFPVWMALFRRGDATADGLVDLTDAIVVLEGLFRDGSAFPCDQAADANDDGGVDVSDAITLLIHLFLGSREIVHPSENCGWDPTPDRLGCPVFPPCE